MQQAKTQRRVRRNETAYEHARKLIAEGRAVIDERDDWSEHQPSAQQENDFIRDHGWKAYARWYLGINEEATEQTKERYEFPYGDFEKVHRCGVLAAESRAGQYDHPDIEAAAAHLHGMLDELNARR
ncbi:MAG TPA: hypothetical protein VFV72_06780 [Candidatus Limnocylindrales bacterium]|nr:hypothetical protein [Candidatus Limnocylindrales bacterium]